MTLEIFNAKLPAIEICNQNKMYLYNRKLLGVHIFNLFPNFDQEIVVTKSIKTARGEPSRKHYTKIETPDVLYYCAEI